MYKYILVFLTFTSISFGQDLKCELLFNDGTTFEGYGTITSEDKIKFRFSLEDESDVWDYNSVTRVTFPGTETYIFEYVKTKIGKQPKLLKVIVDSNVILYVDAKEALIPKANVALKISLEKRKYKLYYLRRENSKKVTFVSTSLGARNWKKKMLEFFKDCPEIVEGIKSKTYTKRDMRAIVEDYYIYCSE